MPRPMAYPKEVKVHLRESQHMALKWQADALGITVAALIRGLVEHHIKKTNQPIKTKAS